MLHQQSLRADVQNHLPHGDGVPAHDSYSNTSDLHSRNRVYDHGYGDDVTLYPPKNLRLCVSFFIYD